MSKKVLYDGYTINEISTVIIEIENNLNKITMLKDIELKREEFDKIIGRHFNEKLEDKMCLMSHKVVDDVIIFEYWTEGAKQGKITISNKYE